MTSEVSGVPFVRIEVFPSEKTFDVRTWFMRFCHIVPAPPEYHPPHQIEPYIGVPPPLDPPVDGVVMVPSAKAEK